MSDGMVRKWVRQFNEGARHAYSQSCVASR
jgi:hypothetical protein